MTDNQDHKNELKRHVIFVIESQYPYYTGGVETWLYNITNRMADIYDISIVTVAKYGNKANGKWENNNKNIKIYPVRNLNHKRFIRLFVHKHIALLNSDYTCKKMAKQINALLDEFGEDNSVLIALGTLYSAKAVRLVKKSRNKVVTIASNRGTHPETVSSYIYGTYFYLNRLQNKNLKSMDYIWTNGYDTKEYLKKKGFESIIIYNGVDIRKLMKQSAVSYETANVTGKRPVLVTIGSIGEIKGYGSIIEAVNILKEKYMIEVDFVGIGKGNVHQYDSLISKYGIESQIHLLGEHRDVVRYAKMADCTLCLGEGGGISMAALESMVSKTIVIAWDKPVYRQIIEHMKNGILVEYMNIEKLAESIKWVIDNKDKCEIIGDNAAKSVSIYDWDNIVESISKELNAL